MFFGIDALLNKAEMKSGGVSDDDIAAYAKLVQDHKVLADVHAMVKENPKVAEYLKNRPSYDF